MEESMNYFPHTHPLLHDKHTWNICYCNLDLNVAWPKYTIAFKVNICDGRTKLFIKSALNEKKRNSLVFIFEETVKGNNLLYKTVLYYYHTKTDLPLTINSSKLWQSIHRVSSDCYGAVQIKYVTEKSVANVGALCEAFVFVFFFHK